MRGSYVFSIDSAGHKHIPFFKTPLISPDKLEQFFLRGKGEFSPEASIAFDKHLTKMREKRLYEIARLFEKRTNLPDLRII